MKHVQYGRYDDGEGWYFVLMIPFSDRTITVDYEYALRQLCIRLL